MNCRSTTLVLASSDNRILCMQTIYKILYQIDHFIGGGND